MARTGRQSGYNRILDSFEGARRGFQECVDHLVALGFSPNQAKNAVHVHRKGGAREARFRLSGERRDTLLDDFGAVRKTNKECVDYLRGFGCTYRQATSAVYKYRQERGLIGK